MSPKKQMIVVAAIALIAAGGYGGYRGGSLYQRHLDEAEAVQNDAGHYNQKTAGFEWGSAEAANLVSLNIDKLMRPMMNDEKPAHFADTTRPAHKPAPHDK